MAEADAKARAEAEAEAEEEGADALVGIASLADGTAGTDGRSGAEGFTTNGNIRIIAGGSIILRGARA